MANDYTGSSIRKWLNHDFYETAFTEQQKSIIKNAPYEADRDTSLESYQSVTIYDKICLASHTDVENKSYGFNQTGYYDTQKQCMGTDYAKCQGLAVSKELGFTGYSHWWLRTSGNDDFFSWQCTFDGRAYLGSSVVATTSFGLRPVCMLSDLRSNTTVSDQLFSETDKPSHTVTYNYSANGGTSATKTTASVAEGAAIDLTPTATKSGWAFIGWNTNPSATTALSSLTMGTSDVTLYAIFKKSINIYNLGEETYSFKNYSDSDSSGGHCFGMSVTSSGYYIGTLSKTMIGGNDNTALYSFGDTATVRKPICYYLHIQGPGPERESMVAGGSIDLHRTVDIAADWNSCVNYVKGHQYDDKGSLNIGMWFAEGGGHAVNFLYYKEVGGQQRIYAYDNNLPTKEIYYYMGSDGYVHREPQDGWRIMGMDLMDVNRYFQLAPSFKLNRYIYAKDGEIVVEDADKYFMKCNPESSRSVMYEIPDSAKEVTITPLVENAAFQYYGSVYSFGAIDEDTKGTLKVISKNAAEGQTTTFTIVNAPNDTSTVSNACKWCGKVHEGFFQKIIGWFHNILAKLFGAKY